MCVRENMLHDKSASGYKTRYDVTPLLFPKEACAAVNERFEGDVGFASLLIFVICLQIAAWQVTIGPSKH